MRIDPRPAASYERPDAVAFRRMVRGLPERPFERLMRSERASIAAAEMTLEKGWRLGALAPLRLEPPVDWAAAGGDHRSYTYHANAWEFSGPLLAAFEATGGRHYLDHVLVRMLDWLEQHPDPDGGHEFAWYDMAVGLRAYRLAYVLDVVARSDTDAEATVAALLDGLLLHLSVLADDARFAGHSNHGFFQAAGQLAAVRRFPFLPQAAEHEEQAHLRLRTMLASQFTAEGVHGEHSPGYHAVVLETVEALVGAGLLTDPESLAILTRACAALGWFSRPDGTLVLLGDTSSASLRAAPHTASPDPFLRHVATAGREGTLPAERVMGLPQSGYVAVRTEDADGGTHLVHMCAFASRTHKHADDLSFTWFDRGRDVFIDAGRYGYLGRTEDGSELRQRGFYYSDPKRIYVESTRAHNTVEIDGVSHDRTRKPYGSAVRGWGDADAACWSEAEVVHAGGVVHHRLIVVRPGSWLFVLDQLEGAAAEHHVFDQWLHAPVSSAVATDGKVVRITPLPGGDTVTVVPAGGVTAFGVRTGITEPELDGWASRRPNELQPAPAFGYRAEGAQARMCFVASWDGAAKGLKIPSPGGGRTLAARFRVGGVTWTIDATGDPLVLKVAGVG